jgi:hypothetical protein
LPAGIRDFLVVWNLMTGIALVSCGRGTIPVGIHQQDVTNLLLSRYCSGHPRFTSSIGYSLANISNTNAQLPNAFHQGQYALANLLYHPVKKVTIGGEFQYGRRLNFTDGYNFNDYRMQFSFRYDWSKGFEF